MKKCKIIDILYPQSKKRNIMTIESIVVARMKKYFFDFCHMMKNTFNVVKVIPIKDHDSKVNQTDYLQCKLFQNETYLK